MAYEYYKSYLSVSSIPSQQYKDDLQAVINDQFDNASDVYIIQEEQTVGKMDWQDVQVRITHVLSDKQTGLKLGDDYRNLIFQDINHAYLMGKRYQFNNSIWITTQTDTYKYVTASTGIRRCNNLLRWIDEFGNSIQEPCIIEPLLKLTTNDFNSNIITPKGYIEIICQYNNKTKSILPNQRFLFGSPRVAYKVRGDGINNFLNQNTYDDSSAPLIKILMDVDQINNAVDNVTDGYANAYNNNYTISIDQGNSLEQNVNYQGQLTATVKNNNIIVPDIALNWSSSDSSICSISPSNGNFMLNQTGSAVVTCALENNPNVSASINITVDAVIVDTYEVRINPQVTELLQNTSQTYNVGLYKNGVLQSDIFTITPSGILNPSTYYDFSSTGNSFTVLNKLKNNIPLSVNCVSGVYSSLINIKLNGLW